MWDAPSIAPGHPDFAALDKIRAGVLSRVAAAGSLSTLLPDLIRDAIDFVIDPVRTARTRIADLDPVEKTFIGLKVEHYFRDLIDVPRGVRDLVIDGVDVDVKNTVGKTWMIPPETYRTSDPCLLIATAEQEGRCWLGLMLARDEYLNEPNRDEKRSVSKLGARNILWVVQGAPFPKSRWDGLDMARFRALRRVRPGSLRAAQFFRENLRRPVHRTIVQALLFDQDDYMKRLRFNGGARDALDVENIALLAGAYGADVRDALGLPALSRDEMISVRATSRAQQEILLRGGHLHGRGPRLP